MGWKICKGQRLKAKVRFSKGKIEKAVLRAKVKRRLGAVGLKDLRLTPNSQTLPFVTEIAKGRAISAPTALRSSRGNVVNSLLVMRQCWLHHQYKHYLWGNYMKLLIGTKNDTRKEYLSEILKGLDLHLLNLKNIEVDPYIDEDGASVTENALKKSKTYYKSTGIPTLSIDTGLFINSFLDSEQPNLFVRRKKTDDLVIEMTDEEMLNYYSRKLIERGGESKGYWKIGISLVVNDNLSFVAEYIKHTYFVSNISSTKNNGEPLNSIQYDMVHNKYLSELTLEERASKEVELVNFIRGFVQSSLGKSRV